MATLCMRDIWWDASQGHVPMLCCRWVGAVGYILLGGVGAGIIPLLYPAVKWYMVAVAFLSAPVFSVRINGAPCSRMKA